MDFFYDSYIFGYKLPDSYEFFSIMHYYLFWIYSITVSYQFLWLKLLGENRLVNYIKLLSFKIKPINAMQINYLIICLYSNNIYIYYNIPLNSHRCTDLLSSICGIIFNINSKCNEFQCYYSTLYFVGKLYLEYSPSNSSLIIPLYFKTFSRLNGIRNFNLL